MRSENSHSSAYCVPVRVFSMCICIALGYGLDHWGFKSRQEMGIFLFTIASRPALGLTQPRIQRLPGALFPGVKRPGREADHLPPSSTEVRNSCTYTYTAPIRLHGAVLS